MFSFRQKLFATFAISCCAAAVGRAGPYVPAAGFPGATAIAASSASFFEWASGYTIERGLVEIDQPSDGFATYGGTNGGVATGSPNAAPIGPAPWPATSQYGIALGQGGTVTLTFPDPITNGSGADFAVFGNGFTSNSSTASFIKPAFVEVSSDGVNFFPFPSASLTQSSTQVQNFGELDPTNLHDLAGKDPAGWGTPFDLSELASVSPLLNVNRITAVRLVDCVDDISPAYASHDSLGNVINAPWPASSSAGAEGFVLEGVGVVNAVPEPGTLAILAGGAVAALALWSKRRRRV